MADEVSLNNNVITKEEADNINKMLIEATSENYEHDILPTWEDLRISAINFLNAYNKLGLLEQQNDKKVIDSVMQDVPTNNATFSLKQIKDAAFFTRAKYVLAFSFDEQVKKFRGQVPTSAVYVHYDSNGQKLSSYTMPLTKLALLANKEGRLNLNPSRLKKENAEQLERDKENFPNQDHLKEAQSAYMGTKSRLMQFYNKSGVEWWHRKNGLLMWKESHKWIIANVTSFGDMKEGYIAALMTNHSAKVDAMYNHEIGNPSYYDHDLIRIFFKNYIQKVTNKAAIVEEDVVTSDRQYAVKSAGASLPSMNQYLKVADWVSKRTMPFTAEELENEINELYPMDAERNKIIGEVNSISVKSLRKITNNLAKARALNKIYLNL